MSFGGILSFILVGFIIFVFLIAIVCVSRYIFGFYFRKCKQCGHLMFFRGKRDRDDESFFFFHCRHCGTWEKISQVEYLRQIGVGINSENV